MTEQDWGVGGGSCYTSAVPAHVFHLCHPAAQRKLDSRETQPRTEFCSGTSLRALPLTPGRGVGGGDLHRFLATDVNSH